MLLIFCLQLEIQKNYGKSWSIKLTVVSMEDCNVMVNCKEFFGTTHYLNL